ncbi:MAG: OmpA family protein [Crocinitomicaceae bacterium]|nr:OmpA family protein [Crocinitomicaceae bacterium]
MKHLLLQLMVLGALSSFQANGQICKPAISVYFETGRSDLFVSEYNRLDAVIAKMDPQSDYLLEIYGFTDSDADKDYNLKLSTNRAEEIEIYIREQFAGEISSVQILPKGEEDPKFSNNSDGTKKLNRRVDVVMFPTKDGKVTITADRGTEVEIALDYFGNCPICESKPEIQEVSSNAEAATLGISLMTRNGGNLQTGGMMKMTHTCEDVDPCSQSTIRIPADQLDPRMKVWQSIDTLGGVRWVQRTIPMEYSADGDFYIMQIPCFRGGGGYNVDLKIPTPEIITPHFTLNRITVLDSLNEKIKVSSGDSESTTATAQYGPDWNDLHKIRHVSDEEGIRYIFKKMITPKYWNEDESVVTLLAKEYSKHVLLTDTTILLKRPWNSRNANLYIPVIDSMYRVKLQHKKNRVYKYKKIEAKSVIAACSKKNPNKCIKLEESALKIKWNKKNKELRIKIRRSAIKELG